MKGVNAQGREFQIPAGRRRNIRGAGGASGGDPAMVLKDGGLGGKIFFIGNHADAQLKLLDGAEGIGAGNQVSGEAAVEEVAGRAGREKKREEAK